MNILILGSGGREHALAWKIKQSPDGHHIFIAPGNPGTALEGTNLAVSLKDFEGIASLISSYTVQMVIIGPEEPLVSGLTDFLEDRFRHSDLIVIGPTRQAAQLEGSKAFAKIFMEEYGIPTAKYKSFQGVEIQAAYNYIDGMNTPIVVKADGLAAGKGVTICLTKEEAKEEIRQMLEGKFGSASQTIVLEEFLNGKEFSVFVLTDGHDYKILPIAKDYKKIGEADNGPNTGGMGAVSPVSFVDQEMMDKVESRVIIPTIKGLQTRGYKYHGFIFLGLIVVDNEPFVIEYNCRMGDPETEVVMPRLSNDLVILLHAIHTGTLDAHLIQSTQESASTVVTVSGGYPGAYEKNKRIFFPSYIPDGSIVFQAGTSQDDQGHTITAGGRVLAITSMSPSLTQALDQSYNLIEQIHYEGKYFRKDIGFDV